MLQTGLISSLYLVLDHLNQYLDWSRNLAALLRKCRHFISLLQLQFAAALWPWTAWIFLSGFAVGIAPACDTAQAAALGDEPRVIGGFGGVASMTIRSLILGTVIATKLARNL